MIQIKIIGRAGNQFFQYATVYSYMKSNNINENINISFQEFKKKQINGTIFVDELVNFNTQYKKVEKIKMTTKQKILDFFYKVTVKIFRIYRKLLKTCMKEKDYKIIEKLWHKILNKNGLYYYMPTNNTFYKSKTNNIIFYGAFENQDFFNAFRKQILKIYTPKNKEKEENKNIYETIKNSNSICISIRRGDFLIKKFKKNYYICTNEYFKKAIKEIEKRVEKPQYVIFSDDIEWCKKNINFPTNTIFESGKDEIWEKIRLMYSCKHFIISNSTFSWWAQYLSRNKSKIVIAPKVWNNFEYSKGIYDDKWILI